ncbi:PLD nuclease N-terminal domain-containing protein [Kitasatospora sp. SUK 42]|uniref:PLD nuclease N-terminal domain-containing protein n=1 Tax=Kitasatospora sp. SUK 42 TaxID=1588882 RepID=UPI0018CA3A7B|nr:PLD nuclease N-terminal domain-containing protein [Kitasatospora sp. SUK 42]MBV2154545.1 PLD nuclease N-terminal domain-containing protein [Kitasatospora sp. SUK 42]
MLRILLTIVLPLALWVWAFIDCLITPENEVRYLPKPIWLIIVLLFPPLGPIAWLVAGKQRGFLRAGAGAADGRTGHPAGAPRGGRPTAPDDDPEFLASLNKESLKKDDKDHESMLRQWEADLRRREEELRGRDEPEDDRKS